MPLFCTQLLRPAEKLDCLLGLPSWPAGPAWASVLPSRASVLLFLGLSTAFPGLQDANWTPIGRQMDANWTPSERQNGYQCQRTSLERQNSCQVQQNALPTMLLSPDGDICNTSIYIYIYIYIYVYIYIYIHIYIYI